MSQDKTLKLDLLDLMSIDESLKEAQSSLKETIEIVSQINLRVNEEDQLDSESLFEYYNDLLRLQKIVRTSGLSKSL
jgi:hypothetical protein